MMGTALAAGAGALGGAVVGGAISNAMFGGGHGYGGGGWGGGHGGGYYDGGDTIIVNNYNTENVTNSTTENYDYSGANDVGGDSGWVEMDNGGDDFGGGGFDDFGGGDW